MNTWKVPVELVESMNTCTAHMLLAINVGILFS